MLKLVRPQPAPDSPRVFGQRVRDARLLRGMSAKETAALMGIGPVRYSRMETSDEGVPASEQEMVRLAEALAFSPGYFQTRPVIRISSDDLCFRAKKSLTKTSKETIASWGVICGELLQETFKEASPVPVVLPNFPAETSPEAAARDVRHLWGLTDDEPIAHLTRRMERAGIYVFSAPFGAGDIPHHDALSTWVGDRRQYPLVMLRDINSWERIRLSLAHEVGHLALHRFGKPDTGEDEAFAFGAALLMPAASLRQSWPQHVTLGSLLPLKFHWGVSLSALIERGHRLGLLSSESRVSLYKQLSRRDRETGVTLRIQEPGWDEREAERPLLVSKLLEARFGADATVEQIRASIAERPEEFVLPILEGQYDFPAKRSNVISIASRRNRG